MTTALCMIVKNEAPVIARCLNSVLDQIDAFFICDTGSTDKTREIARGILHTAGKKGEIVDSNWVDFATNRNEALRGAEDLGDRVLLIDADEMLEGHLPAENPIAIQENGKKATFRVDGYRAKIILGDTSFYRPLLVGTHLDWQFRGAVHEFIMCTRLARLVRTDDFWIRSLGDGARQRGGDKFLRDIQVLRAAIERRPDPRDVFYLAQSYMHAGFPSEALREYERRVQIAGGNRKEQWYSRYQIARCHFLLGNLDMATRGYLEAFDNNPARAEPLYHLGMMFFNKKEYHAARLMLQRASNIAHPGETELFVEESLYRWKTLDAYAVACFETKDFPAARELVEMVLDLVPEGEVERVNENLLAIEEAMGEGWQPDRSSPDQDDESTDTEPAGPSIEYTHERTKPLEELKASDVPRGMDPDDVAKK